MNEEEYHRAHFVEPAPRSAYRFTGTFAVALYFDEFEAAVSYYERVLGPPGYVEGDATRGWRIGGGWLTLLRGISGSPQNVELILQMETPAEAEALQRAFVQAGGDGTEPSDQLMFTRIRSCPTRDPFGTEWLITSPLL